MTVQIIVNVVRQTVKYGIEIIQAFSRELVAARHEKNEKYWYRFSSFLSMTKKNYE